MNDISQKLDALIASVNSLHSKVDALAGRSVTPVSTPTITFKSPGKNITLAELARRGTLANGQQRVAAIVGYFEKIAGKEEILASDIQQGWREGKFTGDYAAVFLSRAIKDGLVRLKQKNAYDLTQTGEDFFEALFNQAN
jgi:hypothetical protein